MNKKLLLAVAAIPAIVTVPTAIEAASTPSSISIEGTPIVNETLKAAIGGLKNTVITGYQWYYVDTTVAKSTDDASSAKKPISGATAMTFKVPAEAAGKTVIVEATSTEGTVYTSDDIKIKDLSLAITAPTLAGHADSKFVAPGETIKVGGAAVTDNAGATLLNSQITYTYQWLYKVGEAFTIIDGAKDSSYSIPADALNKNIDTIMVKVTAKVGSHVVESDFSNVVTVSNAPAETLITAIETLRNQHGQYNMTSFEAFKATVEELDNQYKELPPPLKENVTNYAVLERALADIKAISALHDKMNKLSEIDAEKLPKYIEDIEAAYDKLDFLQRSLDVDNALYDSILAIVKAPTDLADIASVRAVNQKIAALLNYDNNLIQYTVTTVDDLQQAIDDIEADIALISKSYQTTVQNRAILDEAKLDIKKIDQFGKSFDKLTDTTAADKQVTIAKSIRAAYDKLTYQQRQIVPADYVTALLNAENAEQRQIEELNTAIDSYIGDDLYPINPTEQTWQHHVTNVNQIISQYKNLTTSAEASVIGYAAIVQLQKDFKTAYKVITKINDYTALSGISGVKESKLKSSYSSALKAYNKLTTLQQSLVYNEDLLLNHPPSVTVDDNGKEPSDKAAALALKADIDKLADITKWSFTTLQQDVNTATAAYKNLSSAARKHVTNYHLLTTASKDIKAVASFHKKVQTAREETNAEKQAKKIETVDKAFAKLPANQQHLAHAAYQELLENRLDDDSAIDIVALNNKIGSMLANGVYTVTVTDIKALSRQYDKLSTSDKKRIPNAPLLDTAEADVKKVESFMKQYDKSFNSKPETVIKAFTKLSAKQVGLIDAAVRQVIIEAQQGHEESNDAGFAVVELIDGLLINRQYIDNLQHNVTTIRSTYDALSAADKKAVKNYSRLTQAEADLTKVAEVHALYEAIPADDADTARKAWKSAFIKLSKKLELLYTDMYPTDL